MATHDFDYFADRLEVAGWTHESVPRDGKFNCPVSGGSDPLHITERPGQDALTHCFANGCTFGEIVAALDDATVPVVRKVKSKKPKAPLAPAVAEFPCFTSSGDVAAYQVKTADPKRKYRWTDKISDRGVKPEHLHGGLASLPSLNSSARDVIAIVEGHGPAKALNDAGIPAVCTVTGKGAVGWDLVGASFLYARRVVLIPDVGGETHMDKTAGLISSIVESTSIVEWPAGMKANDDAAEFIRDHGADAMRVLISQARPWTRGADEGKDILDLIETDYPPLKFVIPGLLPEGTAILAAAPKIGKSALVYQAAVELALGGVLLDEKLERRPSLYYALEDGERRSKSRAVTALAGRRPAKGVFTLRWYAPKLGAGLEEEIAAWLDDHHDGVVWLDTLEKVRPATSGNRNAYSVDVELLSTLQDIVKARPGSTVVVVLHLRKAGDSDFLARVSGSFGLTGSVDTSVVIERARGHDGATLHVTGRDIGEQQVAATFDGMLWQRDAARIPGVSLERQQVYDVIAELGPIWPTGIANEIVSRGGEQTRESARNLVVKLVEDQWVVWTQQGYTSALPSVTTRSSGSSGPKLNVGGHPRGTGRNRDVQDGAASGDVEEPEAPKEPREPKEPQERVGD